MARPAGELLLASKKTSSEPRLCRAALLSITVSICNLAEAQAGDFAHAKQVYVPPSRIVRRVDFGSMQEQGTVETSRFGVPRYTVAAPAKAPARKPTIKAHSAPPPPPVKKATTLAKLPAKKTPSPLPPPVSANSSILNSVKSKMDPAIAAKMEATARALIKSGRFEEARRLLSQLSPEDQALLKQVTGLSVEQAKELLKQGNLQNALSSTRQALTADPSDASAQNLLNQIHKQNGIDPANVQERLKTAHQLYNQGRYKEAEVEYKASMTVKPTAEARVGLAKVASQIHGYPAARQELEKALELEPNSGAVRRELGLLHLNHGDVVAANSELSRAVILDSKDSQSGSALIKLWQGQVSRLPNANSHLGLARAYQLTGDLPSAQAAYRQVVRLDPNHPYLPAARQSFKIAMARQEADKSIRAARTLEQQGLMQEAFKRAQQASGLSPGDMSYRIYQGELLEKMGLPTQAREAYMNVLKDDPQNVLAAQKIKGLPINAIPGMPLTRHPEGFPGTKFPLPVEGLQIANAAAAGVPPVPGDHVTTLSNFLGSLRGHMNDQKKGMEAFEDIMKKANQAPPVSSDVTEALHTGGGDDFIEKILHSPIGSPLPKGGAEAAIPAGTALAPAAAANAATAAGAANAAMAATAAPTLAGGAEAPVALNPGNAGRTSSVDVDAGTKRLRELEEQNKRLQEELQSLRGPTNQSFLAPSGALPVGPTSPAVSSGSTPFGAGAAPPQVAPALSGTGANSSSTPVGAGGPPPIAPPIAGVPVDTMTSAVPIALGIPGAASGFPSPQSLIRQDVPVAGSSQAPATIPLRPGIPVTGPDSFNQAATNRGAQPSGPVGATPFTNNNAPLRFELREIQPGLTDVKLKVVLRNESGKPFQLPEHVRAVIKYRDSREAEVRIAFNTRTVPGGGLVDGLVKVPLSKVDPTADLILKNVMPAAVGDPDLHLITSLVHK